MASKTVEKKDFENYLQEARSWETDRLIAAEKSKKLAWCIAIFASGLAMISVIAVAGLTPLKTTEIKVLQVDNVTGIVDVVTEIPNSKTNYSEAVNKYFAKLYVRYREGYTHALAAEYYSNVGLMSSSAEQRRFGDFFTPKNPQSPLNVYGTNARVKVSIKSVSFIKEDVALVRYMKEIERSASERPTVTHWAATLIFRYSGSPMKEKDREVNPLGFQVLEFRNDPDSANASPTTVEPIAALPLSRGVTVLPGVPVGAQVPAIAQSADGTQ
jgi:type IV secretion system protein VirB8